jgi:hypothetical protein
VLSVVAILPEGGHAGRLSDLEDIRLARRRFAAADVAFLIGARIFPEGSMSGVGSGGPLHR